MNGIWVNSVTVSFLVMFTLTHGIEGKHSTSHSVSFPFWVSRRRRKRQKECQEVGQQSKHLLIIIQANASLIVFHFFSQSSSAPPSNGFTQMARMMDSLILDSLSTTPYAYTKITTHRPVKKATSTTHLPSSGMVTSSNAPTAARGSYHPNKKIPTQGNVRDSAGAALPFTYFPQLARS
jgi:hypothetical protein